MVGVISSRAKRLAVVCAAAALLGLVFVGSLSQPAGAAFPGHNGRIAFDRVGHDPDSEIFTAKASGSHQRQLTHNSVNDRDPAFSPNGRQIVFDVNETSIHRMRADGSHIQPVTHSGPSVASADPDWQPLPRHHDH
jgi:hypothetical protein